ncbi:hypothetical protein SDC9_211927 [bioreactor metagenome]|uniref:Uncharacterized protein n=1 Tax=bioreactor metagenome TaxID=1076179 RepID=A0A645JL70_9ZZZZ
MSGGIMAGDDPVTGHDQRVGIGAAGLADGARRVVQRSRQLAVGLRAAAGNCRDLRPHPALERGAGRA